MSARPPFIVSLDDVPEETHYLDEPVERFRTRRRLGKATGARTLGVNYSRLRPGQVSSLYHVHSHEEEFLYLLEGRAELRHGGDRIPLETGDAVSLRPGGPPHQVSNPFAEDCLILEIGTRHPEDSISYPEDP